MKPTLSLMRLATVSSVLFLASMIGTGRGDVLSASDGQQYDSFGYSVSVSGDKVVVGANNKNNWQGGAYIYQYDGSNWNETILSASDGKPDDFLGWSVSVSGDTAIIGTSYKNNNEGGAYIYRYDGNDWTETILSASYGQAGDNFGVSVSVSGDNAIIGANGKGNGQGGAYFYQYDGRDWNETTLFASDGMAHDWFGSSVSMSGDKAVVGAHGKGNGRGGAYIYQYDGRYWSETILSASDGQEYDQFGYFVNMSGDDVIVGANAKGNYQGGAYIYRYDGSKWNETILSASDGQAGDNFGVSVSVSGNNAIVGASGKNENRGGAYIYQYNGSKWNEVILSASDGGQAWDELGVSVSIDGDRFAIGGSSGKVYTNTVGALTTFDKGSQIETVVGLNFTSPMDWVVGSDTSGNLLTLIYGTADISAAGKSVYVGQNAGANGNILLLSNGGVLVADAVHIGSVAGNTDNMLMLDGYGGADWTQLASIYLTQGNMLVFSEEFWTSPEQVFAQLGDTKLYASYEGGDVLITLDNYMDYLEIGNLADLPVSSEYAALTGDDTYGNGTYVMSKDVPVIPEPTTSTLWLAAVGLLALKRRK